MLATVPRDEYVTSSRSHESWSVSARLTFRACSLKPHRCECYGNGESTWVVLADDNPATLECVNSKSDAINALSDGQAAFLIVVTRDT